MVFHWFHGFSLVTCFSLVPWFFTGSNALLFLHISLEPIYLYFLLFGVFSFLYNFNIL